MNLDLTRQNTFANILYVLLLILVLWSSWFVMPNWFENVAAISETGTPFGIFVDAFLMRNSFLRVILSSLLIFINSVMVMRLCVRNVIFLERSYMPALIYVMISACHFNSYINLRPLIISLMMIIACNEVFKSYNIKSIAAGKYFKIGALFGFSAVIYEQSITLVPLLFVALIQFRLFDIREWIAAITGFVLPLFFVAYIGWLMGDEINTYFETLYNSIMTSNGMMPPVSSINAVEWFFIGVVSLLILLSVVRSFSNRIFNKNQAFQSYLYFVLIFVVLLLSLIYLPSRSLSMLPLLAIPISVIISTYFKTVKPSLFKNILYLMLVGGVIALQLVPFLRGF